MKNKQTIFEKPFDAAAPMRVDKIEIVREMDTAPDLSYLEQEYEDCEPAEREKYKQQDKETLESYNRGDWHMMGIYAVATVSYPIGNGSRRLETFKSSGLWGIESNSEESYIKSVEQDEINDLKNHLKQFKIKWPREVKI